MSRRCIGDDFNFEMKLPSESHNVELTFTN